MKLLIVIFIFLTVRNTFADEKCQAGKHWVDTHFRKAYVRYDGVHVTSTKVRAYCRKNPRGYKDWHQRLSNKRPKVWGYKEEKSKKWTVEEIQRMFNALSVLPDTLIELKGVKVHRMQQSKFLGNPATSNLKNITVYDQGFRHKDSLAQILSHELSHVLYSLLKASEKLEFRLSAQWESKKKNGFEYFKASAHKKFIKGDSRISIEEDFANHIEYFLFKHRVLQKTSPGAYKWIKERFGKKFKLSEGK